MFLSVPRGKPGHADHEASVPAITHRISLPYLIETFAEGRSLCRSPCSWRLSSVISGRKRSHRARSCNKKSRAKRTLGWLGSCKSVKSLTELCKPREAIRAQKVAHLCKTL